MCSSAFVQTVMKIVKIVKGDLKMSAWLVDIPTLILLKMLIKKLDIAKVFHYFIFFLNKNS